MKTAAVLFSLLSVFAPVPVAETPPLQTVANFTLNDGFSLAPLVLGADDNLYGTVPSISDAHQGKVFRLTPNGVLTTLVTDANGRTPWNAGLVSDEQGNLSTSQPS